MCAFAGISTGINLINLTGCYADNDVLGVFIFTSSLIVSLIGILIFSK